MIGKNIYEIRRRRGLTLTELADRAGIAKSYLSNIERNLNKNPSVNVMEKLALVLDVELKELLNTEKPNESQTDQLDKEWVEFVNELKHSGIDKGQIQEYKTLLEFIKWQNKQDIGNK
ncbi:helix-turn-helix protein [Cytobacillus firmus]|uniref:Helix-turn-helix protein n=3 Tax=Cytobacillus TaxID=2675230 RepID=A0A366JL64_CYTFI|nr:MULTISPECIES: XRE family transcriptional regulator [Cytobacillus]AND41927.1 transcriptional regulator [Cytobacillus oceanisediminis 2691]MCS0826121.1 helix-turn-helix domain-containing protein [Cytobacillus firmus]RBP88274.1 helix-turn-helix protein [Cytobacillus firmus]TDX38347.1 helix-turn-helix protein [Cytobacillus oceanisediminis]